MKKTLIYITDEHFIASGGFCDCYRHPDINDQCIKIQTTSKKASKRLRKELAYYKKLHDRQSNLHYIADYLGTCQTNLGIGYTYQCVLDDDGKVSKTLEYCLENKILEPEVFLKELHQMAIHLLNNRILICDVHAKNILIQHVEGSAPKPVLIDGIGEKIAITVLNIIPSVVQNKIIRRWNRFVDLLVEKYPEIQTLLQERYLSKNDIAA